MKVESNLESYRSIVSFTFAQAFNLGYFTYIFIIQSLRLVGSQYLATTLFQVNTHSTGALEKARQKIWLEMPAEVEQCRFAFNTSATFSTGWEAK